MAQTDSCGQSCPGGAICIPNPLKACSFEELVKTIIKFLQEVALVITAMVIVIAGYYFVTSMGDPARVSQARKMVLYALVGLGIILLAQALVALIEVVIKGGGTSGTSIPTTGASTLPKTGLPIQ